MFFFDLDYYKIILLLRISYSEAGLYANTQSLWELIVQSAKYKVQRGEKKKQYNTVYYEASVP